MERCNGPAGDGEDMAGGATGADGQEVRDEGALTVVEDG